MKELLIALCVSGSALTSLLEPPLIFGTWICNIHYLFSQLLLQSVFLFFLFDVLDVLLVLVLVSRVFTDRVIVPVVNDT